MCGCECCIFTKTMHLSLLSWRERYLKIKDKICDVQNRRSGELANHIFETYEKTVMPHSKHMFKMHLSWLCQKCVHIHHQNMHYHIGNVCCVVVYNVHVLIPQFQNQISRTKM